MKQPFNLAAAAALAGALPLVAPAGAQRGEAAADVAKAGAGDLYEIEAAQIAVRRARDPRARAFAHMLAGNHRRATRQVTAAAGTRPLAPLRRVADGAVPVMEAHLAHARRLQR